MQINLAVHTHTTERLMTLALSGELDLLSSPALERALDGLARSDVELIVADLRGVTFMDSTGLHTLLRLQQTVNELGRRFAFIRGPGQVQRLFELTGLADTLTMVDSPEQLLEVDRASGAP